MSSSRSSAAGRLGGLAAAALRWLASLKLAVTLLVTLAGVLAAATIMEGLKGRDYAQWHVYTSSWFIALLAMLALNVLAATVVRFPWRRKIPFLVAHLGILVLLAGAIMTFRGGIEGQLGLAEGESGDKFRLTHHSQIVAHASDAKTRFTFLPGPSDWDEGKTLKFGEASGVRLKVVRYLAHAAVREDWVADESANGVPAVKFSLADAAGNRSEASWIAAGAFGGLANLGPLEVELQRVGAASLADEFLHPPAAKDMDSNGVLAIHYESRVQRVPVGPNLGKKIPLGDGKLAVELVEYLPSGQPGDGMRFVSRGKEPTNPMLELRVHLPEKKAPLRQIAFAAHPFQNFDGIHGRNCPVKFWYHHPAVSARPGVQFLQTPDGKLYARAGVGGKYQATGEIKGGGAVELPNGLRLAVLEHLPRAQREISFQSVSLADVDDPDKLPGPAVQLEVSAGGQAEKVWLRQNDAEFGTRRFLTPRGPLDLEYTFEQQPLGFSLRLVKFERLTNPGGMGDASFASTVRLVDEGRGVDEEREISMNQPLVHGKYTFFQSGFNDKDHVPVTFLSVAYDPGWLLKYAGSLMICLGVVLLFCKHAKALGRLPLAAPRRAASPAGRQAPEEREDCESSARSQPCAA